MNEESLKTTDDAVIECFKKRSSNIKKFLKSNLTPINLIKFLYKSYIDKFYSDSNVDLHLTRLTMTTYYGKTCDYIVGSLPVNYLYPTDNANTMSATGSSNFIDDSNYSHLAESFADSFVNFALYVHEYLLGLYFFKILQLNRPQNISIVVKNKKEFFEENNVFNKGQEYIIKNYILVNGLLSSNSEKLRKYIDSIDDDDHVSLEEINDIFSALMTDLYHETPSRVIDILNKYLYITFSNATQESGKGSSETIAFISCHSGVVMLDPGFSIYRQIFYNSIFEYLGGLVLSNWLLTPYSMIYSSPSTFQNASVSLPSKTYNQESLISKYTKINDSTVAATNLLINRFNNSHWGRNCGRLNYKEVMPIYDVYEKLVIDIYYFTYKYDSSCNKYVFSGNLGKNYTNFIQFLSKELDYCETLYKFNQYYINKKLKK